MDKRPHIVTRSVSRSVSRSLTPPPLVATRPRFPVQLQRRSNGLLAIHPTRTRTLATTNQRTDEMHAYWVASNPVPGHRSWEVPIPEYVSDRPFTWSPISCRRGVEVLQREFSFLYVDVLTDRGDIETPSSFCRSPVPRRVGEFSRGRRTALLMERLDDKCVSGVRLGCQASAPRRIAYIAHRTQ